MLSNGLTLSEHSCVGKYVCTYVMYISITSMNTEQNLSETVRDNI